jgi:hypothetical protein
MMTLSDVRKRLATILAVVMVVVLVGCSSTSDEGTSSSGSSGERTPCSECDAQCRGAESPIDCEETCLRDCLP